MGELLNDTILIIDTNTASLRRLREILSKEGYNIMTATETETAVNIINKLSIDYIISSASTITTENNSINVQVIKNNKEA